MEFINAVIINNHLTKRGVIMENIEINNILKRKTITSMELAIIIPLRVYIFTFKATKEKRAELNKTVFTNANSSTNRLADIFQRFFEKKIKLKAFVKDIFL